MEVELITSYMEDDRIPQEDKSFFLHLVQSGNMSVTAAIAMVNEFNAFTTSSSLSHVECLID